jgi:cell division protein FtsB
MKKLKEEFDLINRLIHEYREENDKLKEANKALVAQGQRGGNFAGSHSQFSSPQHSSIKGSHLDVPQRHLSPPPRSSIIDPGQDSALIRLKLGEEIDRLNRINTALQSEIHDLRLGSSDNVALRKRLEENLSLIVILFAEVESLRMRLKESDGKRNLLSPIKGGS